MGRAAIAARNQTTPRRRRFVMMDDTRHAEREAARQALWEARLLRRERRHRSRAANNDSWIRLVIGLSILAVGIVAWLHRLGRLHGTHFLASSPLILTPPA